MSESTREKIEKALEWAQNCLADHPNYKPVIDELYQCKELLQNAVIFTEEEQEKMNEIYNSDRDIFIGEELSNYINFLYSDEFDDENESESEEENEDQ